MHVNWCHTVDVKCNKDESEPSVQFKLHLSDGCAKVWSCHLWWITCDLISSHRPSHRQLFHAIYIGDRTVHTLFLLKTTVQTVFLLELPEIVLAEFLLKRIMYKPEKDDASYISGARPFLISKSKLYFNWWKEFVICILCWKEKWCCNLYCIYYIIAKRTVNNNIMIYSKFFFNRTGHRSASYDSIEYNTVQVWCITKHFPGKGNIHGHICNYTPLLVSLRDDFQV